MLKFVFCLILSVLISFSAVAKTIDQKKNELKKIYEAGGISKIEFEKANNFLEEATKEEKKIKKSLSLNKDKKKKNSIFKKNKDPILEEDLEKLEVYNKEIFEKEFLEYAPEVIEFFGKSSNVVSRGKKAGKFMSIEFNRSEQGQQRFPGRMIKAMAAFEIFYIDSLRKNRKSLERYKANKGKKFWYLGEFLDLGKALKNDKYETGLDKRKKLLIEYKQKISLLKEKIKDEQKIETIN